MKTKLQRIVSVGVIGIMILTSFKTNAQADVLNHNRVNGFYLGWNSAGTSGTLDVKNDFNSSIDFYTNTTKKLSLTSVGDLNLTTSGKAYQINANNVLWHGGNTQNIFTGVGAGASTTGLYNTFNGNNAGGSNTTGARNTAVGYQALFNSTNQWYQTAIGFRAIYSYSLTAPSDSANNTAVGYEALYNTQAYGGCALGWRAAKGNTTGCGIVAIGEEAVENNTTGNNNVGMGTGACAGNSTGSYNTCLGWNAGNGVLNNSHNYNSFFGAQAGFGITTGDGNTFTGYQAASNNTSGHHNTASGANALGTNVTGAYNCAYGDATLATSTVSNLSAFGHLALHGNTTGTGNDAFGDSCLYTNGTGASNTAFGARALLSNNTGNNNVAVGLKSLYANATGSGNTAVGFASLVANTANGGTAIGYEALLKNTAATNNTAVGYQSLLNTTGSTNANNNTALGYQAGSGNTSGANNTFVGYQAGSGNTTGANNTFVGYLTTASATTYTNCAAFGNGASVSASDKISMGNSSIVGVYCTTGTFVTSDGRFKTNVTESVKGLEFINKLRPVTYNLNTEALDNFLIQNLSDSLKQLHKAGMDFRKSKAIVHSGFIAQEVEKAAKEVGFNSSIVSAPSNDADPYALSYAEIVVPLVKGMQEQQKMIDSLEQKNKKQDAVISKQNAMINKQDSINKALQNQINQLVSNYSKSASATAAANNQDVDLSDKNVIVLNQNVPNPFAEQTIISYNIPENAGFAQIIFYNSLGQLIKAVDIKTKGRGRLTVFANDLTSGIYSYSLIVDGKTIDTKRMVKTD